MRKSFSLAFFFFHMYFLGTKHSLYVLTSLEKAKVTHVWDALERGEPLAFLLC